MTRKVLVALDGSEQSEAALPWVRLIAPYMDVTLLQVVEQTGPFGLFPGEVGERLLQGENYLKSLADQMKPRARVLVRKGPVAAEILQAAEELGADLIVLTAQGGAGVRAKLLGGTAEKLAHSAPIPLLIVPSWEGARPAPRRIRKIAVPLDASENSERIIPLACAFGLEQGAALVLVHAFDEMRDLEEFAKKLEGDDPESPDAVKIRRVIEQRREEIERHIGRVIFALSDSGMYAKFTITRARATEGILGIVKREEADMIILSAHGRGAIRRMLLGSVAGRLIRESPVPVLVARHEALERLKMCGLEKEPLSRTPLTGKNS